MTALAAAWFTTPGWAACIEDRMAVATEPRPTLTVNLADTGGDFETVGAALRRTAIGIRLEDVRVEGTSVTGFRVFVNAPDARFETPIDDPAYVTSFSFFPAPAPGSPAGTFVVDLGPALNRLAAREGMGVDDPVTITLVPVGTEDAQIGLGSLEIVE